jgi:hypothetical protein
MANSWPVRFVAYGRNHWFLFITAAALLIAALIMVLSKNLEQAAQIGEFVSGFASALAFLWLIASFQMQSGEIAAQRAEMKLQSTALEGQAKELRNASKFSALAQIADIIDRTKGRVRASKLVKDESELIGLFLGGLPNWKVILESKDAQLIQNHTAVPTLIE